MERENETRTISKTGNMLALLQRKYYTSHQQDPLKSGTDQGEIQTWI